MNAVHKLPPPRRHWRLICLGNVRWRGVLISHLDFTDVVTPIGTRDVVMQRMTNGAHRGLPILPDASAQEWRDAWNRRRA